MRRSISKPTELAYYICRSRTPVPLTELVRVAGSRWGVEETFQFAKNDTGLDHYQVRRYGAWYRHITLSMLAAASWPSPPTPNDFAIKKGHHRQRRAPDSPVLQRNPALVGHPEPPPPQTPPHQPLAHLAMNPSDTRKTKPLPATTPQISQGAAAVLGGGVSGGGSAEVAGLDTFPTRPQETQRPWVAYWDGDPASKGVVDEHVGLFVSDALSAKAHRG